uniref:Uncharacterized protein n=1 Tax=Rhizophora mucronata TaxID=61149 RepID=A0A2P2LTX4_RHIMU
MCSFILSIMRTSSICSCMQLVFS